MREVRQGALRLQGEEAVTVEPLENGNYRVSGLADGVAPHDFAGADWDRITALPPGEQKRVALEVAKGGDLSALLDAPAEPEPEPVKPKKQPKKVKDAVAKIETALAELKAALG